ncbi:MAG TPA: diguanylate cyclase [Acidimicrobiia bacterium]|jgi:diguanylate cyclase (GGDEF)-like protein
MAILRDRDSHLDEGYRQLFDPATRLPRPALLRDRLEVALARATRTKRRVGVLFVDVEVPDDIPSGRGSSFDVLPLIAGRLRSAVRPDDTVARVGEHEFVVICNDVTDDLDLAAVAERLESVIGVRIFLDEAKSVLSARVEARLGAPGDRAVDLLTR